MNPGTQSRLAGALKTALSAFDEVLRELERQGVEAFRAGNYAQADRFATEAKSAQELRIQIAAVSEKLASLKPSATPLQAATVPEARRGQRTTLRITFPDGYILQRPRGADCFTEALQRLGLERVAELNIRESGVPLVGRVKDRRYTQRHVDGWYVVTHSNTLRKKTTLHDIATRLGIKLKVEILPA